MASRIKTINIEFLKTGFIVKNEYTDFKSSAVFTDPTKLIEELKLDIEMYKFGNSPGSQLKDSNP